MSGCLGEETGGASMSRGDSGDKGRNSDDKPGDSDDKAGESGDRPGYSDDKARDSDDKLGDSDDKARDSDDKLGDSGDRAAGGRNYGPVEAEGCCLSERDNDRGMVEPRNVSTGTGAKLRERESGGKTAECKREGPNGSSLISGQVPVIGSLSEGDSVHKAATAAIHPGLTTAGWPTLKVDLIRGIETAFEDEVAVEYPLTIKLNGEEFATVVCTPADLTDLVVGFLASEGVIRSYSDIERIHLDEPRGFAYVELHNKRIGDAVSAVSKRFISSCCGKSRQFYLQSDVRTAKTVPSSARIRITAEQCVGLMSRLQQQSADFQRTGGLHNAALGAPGATELAVVRSDIGRHNALDKMYGHCLTHRLPTLDKAIAFSGRVSSEVLLKASKIGSAIVLSKSAPSDLALKLAQDLGITVVGFIREGRINVYTHPNRVVFQ
jgi:FdhD protein